mmetsp:Transcript_45500/g.147872  ORF Transcript_45500/g.147872 Transcript_45500/m.147872 type:complete len:235 (-) Transcript_45500:954-1658(-)
MHAPCSRCGALGWARPPRARYPAAVAGLTLPAIVHFRATLSATHPVAMAMAASSSFWCGGQAADAARRSGLPSSPTHKSTPHEALFFRSRTAPPRASERLRIGQEHGARPDVGVVDVRHGAAHRCEGVQRAQLRRKRRRLERSEQALRSQGRLDGAFWREVRVCGGQHLRGGTGEVLCCGNSRHDTSSSLCGSWRGCRWALEQALAGGEGSSSSTVGRCRLRVRRTALGPASKV